jgi:hypothetical protein
MSICCWRLAKTLNGFESRSAEGARSRADARTQRCRTPPQNMFDLIVARAKTRRTRYGDAGFDVFDLPRVVRTLGARGQRAHRAGRPGRRPDRQIVTLTTFPRSPNMNEERVQDHYASAGTGSGIAARIAAAVRATGGPNTSITPETLAPFDHFHGGGLAAQRHCNGRRGRQL